MILASVEARGKEALCCCVYIFNKRPYQIEGVIGLSEVAGTPTTHSTPPPPPRWLSSAHVDGHASHACMDLQRNAQTGPTRGWLKRQPQTLPLNCGSTGSTHAATNRGLVRGWLEPLIQPPREPIDNSLFYPNTVKI